MAKKSNRAKVTSGVSARAKKIRVLLMDVDGVLTDGRIWLLSRRDGTASEIKGFSAYDGAGLKLARAAGLRTGLITGRESSAVTQRACSTFPVTQTGILRSMIARTKARS